MSPEAHIFEAIYTTPGSGPKFDTGKLRYSLVPPTAVKALAEVLTFGAKKYAPNSWQLVDRAQERYLDALMRHLEAYRSGELIDPESGLPHLSHLLCNASFLLHFQLKDLNEKI
jgi:hypothetical protein